MSFLDFILSVILLAWGQIVKLLCHSGLQSGSHKLAPGLTKARDKSPSAHLQIPSGFLTSHFENIFCTRHKFEKIFEKYKGILDKVTEEGT